MKALILAGGRGSRLSEETSVRPKPMVEIGGRPILWHIMRIYSTYGVNEFVICLGYKGYLIKEYFANYRLHRSDVTIDLSHNRMDVHRAETEPWRVTLIETGDDTMTGGRVKRGLDYIDDDEFFMTYGDGVADIDIDVLLAFHRAQGARATLTAVQPPGRFGAVELDGDRVHSFSEKPLGDGGWVNGGFFVLSRSVGDYIDGDDTVWEQEPLQKLAEDAQLACYRHRGFWHPMDTLRDKDHLEMLWQSGEAPWAR